MRYRLAPRAEAELDEIWYYLVRSGAGIQVATRQIEELTASFSRIARNPRMGRSREYDLKPGLRSLPVRDYIVLYRITQSEILILHVLRGARNIPAIV